MSPRASARRAGSRRSPNGPSVCAVGRTTTSLTSTSAGCSMAKAMARAIASGAIGITPAVLTSTSSRQTGARTPETVGDRAWSILSVVALLGQSRTARVRRDLRRVRIPLHRGDRVRTSAPRLVTRCAPRRLSGSTSTARSSATSQPKRTWPSCSFRTSGCLIASGSSAARRSPSSCSRLEVAERAIAAPRCRRSRSPASTPPMIRLSQSRQPGVRRRSRRVSLMSHPERSAPTP